MDHQLFAIGCNIADNIDGLGIFFFFFVTLLYLLEFYHSLKENILNFNFILFTFWAFLDVYTYKNIVQNISL